MLPGSGTLNFRDYGLRYTVPQREIDLTDTPARCPDCDHRFRCQLGCRNMFATPNQRWMTAPGMTVAIGRSSLTHHIVMVVLACAGEQMAISAVVSDAQSDIADVTDQNVSGQRCSDCPFLGQPMCQFLPLSAISNLDLTIPRGVRSARPNPARSEIGAYDRPVLVDLCPESIFKGGDGAISSTVARRARSRAEAPSALPDLPLSCCDRRSAIETRCLDRTGITSHYLPPSVSTRYQYLACLIRCR